MNDYQALMDRVKVLQPQGCWTPKMAEILNTEGWVPPKQRGTYIAPMVRSLLKRQGISLGTPKQQHTSGIPREADEWTLKELAQQLQMPEPTLYKWLKRDSSKHGKCKRTPDQFGGLDRRLLPLSVNVGRQLR